MKCTMPKCRSTINGLTGLDEIVKLRQHFAKAHKMPLTMEEALEVRIDIENGIAPNLLRAMLGTENIKRKGGI